MRGQAPAALGSRAGQRRATAVDTGQLAKAAIPRPTRIGEPGPHSTDRKRWLPHAARQIRPAPPSPSARAVARVPRPAKAPSRLASEVLIARGREDRMRGPRPGRRADHLRARTPAPPERLNRTPRRLMNRRRNRSSSDLAADANRAPPRPPSAEPSPHRRRYSRTCPPISAAFG